MIGRFHFKFVVVFIEPLKLMMSPFFFCRFSPPAVVLQSTRSSQTESPSCLMTSKRARHYPRKKNWQTWCHLEYLCLSQKSVCRQCAKLLSVCICRGQCYWEGVWLAVSVLRKPSVGTKSYPEPWLEDGHFLGLYSGKSKLKTMTLFLLVCSLK